MTRAVALIDGEHYAPVVRDALAALPYEWVGAILVGGTEKLRDGRGLRRAARRRLRGRGARRRSLRRARARPGRAVPLGVARARRRAAVRRRRLSLRSARLRAVRAAVDRGHRHRQARREDSGHRAPRAAARAGPRRRRRRDGPRRAPRSPRWSSTPPSVADLVALARSGRHAASDHLEIAALCGVPTIGCRRAGGGLAGAVFTSNVAAGARLAAERAPDVVVFDGSGAAIPPVDVDRRVLVVGPGRTPDAYLNTYRRLISDVVVSVGCDAPDALRADLRLRATAPLEGRVAVFTAGATDVAHLDADVVHVSANLADRAGAPTRARAGRRRHLPRRGEGGRDRRRRRARARARQAGRARRERRGRRRPRRRAAGARSRSGSPR